jgi:hypothetical protein
MKNLFLLFLLVTFNSCIVEKVALEEYKIINSTEFNLKFIAFQNSKIDSQIINKNAEFILEQFRGSEQLYPFDVYDSIMVKFSDNKVLKYLKTDDCAFGKSFFCSKNTTCVEKACTFEIDSVEYLKAK